MSIDKCHSQILYGNSRRIRIKLINKKHKWKKDAHSHRESEIRRNAYSTCRFYIIFIKITAD